MSTGLLLICLLTLVIHAAETSSYAIRLAGIRSRKLAVALSLTGMVLLVARTSNLFQSKYVGALVDEAKAGQGADLGMQLHLILGGAALGTLASILLFPTLAFLSMRLVARLEAVGSIPALMRESVSVDKLKMVRHYARLPRLQMLSRLRIGGIPKRLLLLNTLITGIYTVGVLSAMYAAFLVPQSATEAVGSSGIINGVATILLTLFVDPRVALLTDRVMGGKTSEAEMQRMFGLLMISRLAGTLLAHLLLWPGAQFVVWYISLD
ncbi:MULTISPECIES: lipid II flippase Amj family protein [Paenibacillus]|uniref:lipid II flippase Amj family protein n=1 Tax=Paenibacillus TaxID=44249 RepID=UPI0022B8F0C4|nr:lipid II flippase Amj family protein [Paenibacillus caseinilyticus]MCZ8523660.1 lipid II flippase Amj family protein [Paenibacillus caseinilyticus]